MRALMLILTAGMLVLASAETARAEQPPRGSRGCSLEDLDGARDVSQSSLLPGPAGRFVVLLTSRYRCEARDPDTGRRAPWSNNYSRYGLETLEGQNLIPRQYDAILPYSETAAFVQREDKRWVRYRFGRGEEPMPPGHNQARAISPLLAGEFGCPPQRGQASTTALAAISMSAPDARNQREVAFYSGDGPPLLFTGLGGPGVDHPIEMHGGVLVTHWIDASGGRRSRIYNRAGEPLTPELGRVERWASEASSGTDHPVCRYFQDLELYVAGPALDTDPANPTFGALLLPIDERGGPVALPRGAIGVMAVPRRFHGANRLPSSGWGRTKVWAVVYPTNDGFSFTLTQGSLRSALAAAPTEPRFKSLGRWIYEKTSSTVETGHLLFVPVGRSQWQGRIYDRWDILGPPADTSIGASNNVGREEHSLDYDAFSARYEAQRVASQRRYSDALAAGSACTLPAAIASADDATIFAHAQACPQNYSLNDRNWLRWRGAPAHVLSGVDQAQQRAEQAAAAQRAEWAEQARNYVSPSQREAMWRIAGDAWIKGIQDGAEAQQTQRRRQFEADWQRSQRAY